MPRFDLLHRPSGDAARRTILLASLGAPQHAIRRRSQSAAMKLLSVGESKRDEKLDPVEHAA